MNVIRRVASRVLSARSLTVALIALVLLAAGAWALRWSIDRSRESAVATLTLLLRSDRLEVRTAAADQLLELGADGISPLVLALNDDREDVFSLAAQSFDRALTQWQFLPPAEASDRLHRFSKELNDCLPTMPEERRYVARRWAQRMALWPRDDDTGDLSQVLLRCESILRSSPVLTEVESKPAASQVASSKANSQRSNAEALIDDRLQSPLTYVPPPSDDDQLAALPLMSPGATSSESPPPTNPEPTPALQAAEPKRLVAPQAQPLPTRQLELTSSKPQPAQSQAIDDGEFLRQQSDLDVMRSLHDLSVNLSAAAEAELRRRGYRTVDLPICRALVHPDPDVRRKLAEALPTMHNIDARPWLLQLSQDDHADVRRAAEGILRTSRDPALESRFR